MRNNKSGITLIKFLIIIIITIVLLLFLSILYVRYYNDIGQTIEIWYNSMNGKINIDEEIKENEILLGVTDVSGEGVQIDILDGKDLIHQEDLIIMIDELKNSGAQAISINEQRITNLSYLYCDGAVILIDGEKIGNPFTIKAIGNSETIYGALMRNKGYISVLQKDGIEINVTKQENIEIKKTNKKELLNYAKNMDKVAALKTSNQLIGKSDVTGKGIEIIITGGSSKLSALNFLQMVNDLQCAGAKAISINGNRITSMTDMMDISSTYVIINSIPISAPYIIDAIGDQEKILEVLNYTSSQINKIQSKSYQVDIYKFGNLKVEKYVQKKDKNKMDITYLR